MRRKRGVPLEHPIWSKAMEYVYILVGSAIIALAFNVFLLPNEIASGGVSGISTILHGVFNWKPAYVQWALNIPLLLPHFAH